MLILRSSYDSFFFLVLHQDNPSDKDINQGTLVVFNLDPSVSNEDLRQIFGAYGEVKEVIVHLCLNYSFPHFLLAYFFAYMINICAFW